MHSSSRSITTLSDLLLANLGASRHQLNSLISRHSSIRTQCNQQARNQLIATHLALIIAHFLHSRALQLQLQSQSPCSTPAHHKIAFLKLLFSSCEEAIIVCIVFFHILYRGRRTPSGLIGSSALGLQPQGCKHQLMDCCYLIWQGLAVVRI